MGLEVRDLWFSLGGRPVLRGISFEAPVGEVTAILGANGSGKSTLLKTIAGVHPCPPGAVAVLGRDLSRAAGAERASLLGYLPQFHRPVFSFAVEDVVLTGRAAYAYASPRPRDRERVRAALEAVGIAGLAGRTYGELSGGERQLVLIARVLAQDPRVILLDEPTSHLDFANQGRLAELLGRLAAWGKAVVAVLHDPNLAFACAGRLVFLAGGRVAEPQGAPWDAAFLTRVYGTAARVGHWEGRPFLLPPMAGTGSLAAEGSP
jgi:iron complex transport system ATP-binding protein